MAVLDLPDPLSTRPKVNGIRCQDVLAFLLLEDGSEWRLKLMVPLDQKPPTLQEAARSLRSDRASVAKGRLPHWHLHRQPSTPAPTT